MGVKALKTSELLQQLELYDEENAFVTKEESGLDTDIRTVILPRFGTMYNTGEAEFFFHKTDNEDGSETNRIFVCRYLIISGVQRTTVALLCAALAAENYEMIPGTLGYDPEENAVTYTLSTPFPDDMSDEEMKRQAEISMRVSWAQASQYAAVYEAAAKGAEYGF